MKPKNLSETKLAEALEWYVRHVTDFGPASQDQRTRDFVFHLSDCIEDIQKAAVALSTPAKSDAFKDAINGLLIHASGHVNAAAEIAGWEPIAFDKPQVPVQKTRRAAGVTHG